MRWFLLFEKYELSNSFLKNTTNKVLTRNLFFSIDISLTFVHLFQ